MAQLDATKRLRRSVTAWLLAPISAISDFVRSKSYSLIPYIIPILVFVVVLPLLIVLSFGAGWMVWTSVPKGWREQVYLQYGDGMPHAELLLNSLVSDQAYTISLQLLLPHTSKNHELGNFMSSIVLLSTSNKTLASASRASILSPPPSSYFSRSAPSLIHTVHLLSAFIPGSSSIIARIELGRKDAWKSLGRGEGKELTVLDAYLVGDVKLAGLRALIASFPLLSAVISTVTFFAFSLTGLLFFAAVYAYFTPRDEPPPAPKRAPEDTTPLRIVVTPSSVLTPSSISGDETPSTPSTIMPEITDGTPRLRRRRTSSFDFGTSASEAES